MLCLGASFLLNTKHRKYVASYQARRDAAAIKLFNAARSSGDEQKFAVFLRPFYTRDKIKSTQVIMIPQFQGTTVTYTQIYNDYQLEEMVVEAFRYTMPVIALGKPGETFGVGRILVDEEQWQGAASELTRRASLIICLPSSRPGSH